MTSENADIQHQITFIEEEIYVRLHTDRYKIKPPTSEQLAKEIFSDNYVIPHKLIKQVVDEYYSTLLQEHV